MSREDPKCLESYLDVIPEIGTAAAFPADLIFEEVKVRGQSGNTAELSDLPRRFPQQAAELQALLGTLATEGDADEFAPTQTTDVTRRDLPRQFDEVTAGEAIDDFELLLPLGSGSFARVFLARQISLDRLVALKISKRVGTEPRTLAQLDHPNIVRVFDQRTCSTTGLGLLYMELVPGGTLQDVTQIVATSKDTPLTGQLVLDRVDARLGQCGTAPPEESQIRNRLRQANWPSTVCFLGARLANGLAYAHQRGVLHRDIKPANVLLTPEGSPKLADFNVSFLGGRAGEPAEDTFGGSLGYMSPEQIAACHPALGGSRRDVLEASDVYSMGVVLWEMLTGERPFDDPPPTQNWSAMLQDMIDRRSSVDLPTLVARLPSTCPRSLRQVLQRCLQPDVGQRFQSAQGLADALRLCLNPRCWRLLQPPDTRLGAMPLRFPTLTVLCVTLLPSIFAAVFNLLYNRQQIIRYLHGAESTFDRIQAIINGTAFPFGIAITIYLAYRTVAPVSSAAKSTPEPLPDVDDRRVVKLGHVMARLALSLWLISGLAYPLSLHMSVPDSITWGVYIHFALSLALCGILAGTYPFFFVTYLAVRWFLPEMIRRELIRGPSLEGIDWLRRMNRTYLVMTAFVPLLGILLILLYSQDAVTTLQTARLWLIIASATGLLGFAWMYWLHRVIDEDLLALRTLSPDADRSV